MALRNFSTFQELEEACRVLECSWLSQQDYVQPSTEVLQDQLYGNPDFSPKNNYFKKSTAAVGIVEDNSENSTVSCDPVFIRTKNSNGFCFNCEQKGHQHKDCSKPKTIFCYLCGKKGVTSVQCNCQSNSSKSGSSFTEEQLKELSALISAAILKGPPQSGQGN